jgi:hypothetical protein
MVPATTSTEVILAFTNVIHDEVNRTSCLEVSDTLKLRVDDGQNRLQSTKLYERSDLNFTTIFGNRVAYVVALLRRSISSLYSSCLVLSVRLTA